jgi:hypothetical protein
VADTSRKVSRDVSTVHVMKINPKLFVVCCEWMDSGCFECVYRDPPQLALTGYMKKEPWKSSQLEVAWHKNECQASCGRKKF